MTTPAETLLIAAARSLALHRGSSSHLAWTSALTAAGAAAAAIPAPGPGPQIGGLTLRSVIIAAVERGPEAMPDTQHFLRILLADLAMGELRQAAEAFEAAQDAA